MHTLQLRFTNDEARPDGDRNIHILSIEVHATATASPTPTVAAAWLKSQLRDANIVLISVDSLRWDAVAPTREVPWSRSGSTRLADRGVAFAQAWSSSHWTLPAHASLLTSLHPAVHGAMSERRPERVPEEVEALAEVLQAQGYLTAGFAGGRWVTPQFGLAQGFQHWEGDATVEASIHDAKHRTDAALEWIDQAATDSTPFFAFLHYYQVHSPYGPPEAQAAAWLPELSRERRHALANPLAGDSPSAQDLRDQRALYDADVRVVDEAILDLVQGLESRAVLDRTLIVLTSDHGEEFMEHGWIGHGQLYPEVTRIPLVVSHPALRVVSSAQHQANIGLIDVAPTLVDLVGHQPPQSWQGRSLVGLLSGQETPDAPVRIGGIRPDIRRVASVEDGAMVIVDGPRTELFDLAEDPGQVRPLSVPRRDELLAATEAWAASLTPISSPEPAELDADDRAMLRALGYIVDELDSD